MNRRMVNNSIITASAPKVLWSPVFSNNFFMNFNLLERRNTLINLRSLRYLKILTPGIIAGKITSKGIEAISPNIFSLSVRKSFLGLERYRFHVHSIKRIIQIIKSKDWIFKATSAGISKIKAIVIKSMSKSIKPL